MAAEAQARAGITPQLLRLSIGIEATKDLICDVRLGLDRVHALRSQPRSDIDSVSRAATY